MAALVSTDMRPQEGHRLVPHSAGKVLDPVVTYTVRDTTGGIRGNGIKTWDEAAELAAKVCEESIMPIACEIERVTYCASRLTEVVATISKKAA